MESQRIKNNGSERAEWQVAKKTLKFFIWSVFCCIVFEVGIFIFNDTPAKWYARFNCLCGRAHFHAGEEFTPDAMLFYEIGDQELSDGQIRIFGTHCRKHDERIWITIYSKDAYSVQGIQE